MRFPSAPPPCGSFHQDPNIPVSIDSIAERARNLEANQFRDQVLVLQCKYLSGNSIHIKGQKSRNDFYKYLDVSSKK